MFEKKLDKKDLKEMVKIRELIHQYAFIINSLKVQEKMYFFRQKNYINFVRIMGIIFRFYSYF